jgi:quercetin dioxygenase-like cupin family protein
VPDKVFLSSLSAGKRVTMRPGIDRVTMSYNDDNMLCYFYLAEGTGLPLHTHLAAQNGFVISGRIRFFRESGESFVAGPGDGYIFESNEAHGSEILEDSEIIECFTPMRPDYVG